MFFKGQNFFHFLVSSKQKDAGTWVPYDYCQGFKYKIPFVTVKTFKVFDFLNTDLHIHNEKKKKEIQKTLKKIKRQPINSLFQLH